MCRIMRHLVIKLELLAPGEVFCISRHLARSLVKHSELLIKIQNVNIVRQKFLFENGPSKQIMNNHNIYIAADRIPVNFGSQAHPF